MTTAPPISLAELEKDPRLFLYTSLTAGSSHIITATSRLETILKANKIPFQAIDMATDEKARRLWQRRAGGRKLPGLVKEGYVIGDLTEIEEWNEFGELHENIGPVPAHNTAAPTGGQVGVQIAPPSMFAPQQKGPSSSATTGVYGQTAVPAAKLPEAGFDKTKGIALPGAAEVAAIAAKKIAEKTGVSIPASNPAAMATTKVEEKKVEEKKEEEKKEETSEKATEASTKGSAVATEPEVKAVETKPAITVPKRKMSISFAEEPSKSTAAASAVSSPTAAETKELLTSGSSKTAAETAPILQKETPKKETIPAVTEEDEQDEVEKTSEKIAGLKVEDKAAAPQQDTEAAVESKSEEVQISEPKPKKEEVAAPPVENDKATEPELEEKEVVASQVAETEAEAKQPHKEELKTQEQDAKDASNASLSVED